MSVAHNILQFGRLLRRAGLPVGPTDMLAAVKAADCIDIGARGELHAALCSTLTRRPEHRVVFDEAFALFWRAPIGHGDLAPGAGQSPPPRPAPGTRRVAEAMSSQRTRTPAPHIEDQDATWTASASEVLRKMDFEAMSADELEAARQAIRRMTLPDDRRLTRRRKPAASGTRADLTATLRHAMRQGGEITDLRHTRLISRTPPLVVLCDISGSMARYAAILLHFLHAVTQQRAHVQVFLFGTRLTNVTRQLRARDAEVAYQAVAVLVPDWSGGTRIAEVLHDFNRLWSRRVLAQGASVLLLTDGLDRPAEAGGPDLANEMARLHRSARRLIWLNPLLRWNGFEPRAASIAAMLPHVDVFRSAHSLESLEALVGLLSDHR